MQIWEQNSPFFTEDIKKYDIGIVLSGGLVDFDIYSTNNIIVRKRNSFDFLFIPSALSLYQWDLLIHEITGFYIYGIAGYA
jgi:hypothetical protein